nr:MAG TPA: hypothetical protein [Caudoviricetes sp.]
MWRGLSHQENTSILNFLRPAALAEAYSPAGDSL